VRRSDRARRVQVRVLPDGRVEVVLPRRARARHAAAAVAELRPWIERRLALLDRARVEAAGPPGTVPYLGTPLRLRPEPGRRRVHRTGDVLHVPAGPGQRAALERWYRRRARAEVLPRLDAACAVLGRPHAGLTVRDTRTRWASCAASGAMSFSWRLLLAPADVLDYVVWHEACHLLVPGHTPAFWALVAEHCPGYERPRAWLRRNGAGLSLP
jgi:predicted metal-dependent hydrolase